ncbi:MAG: MMPL family transporter [Myxococcales bacterium]|nr:MMPL family transporter [Myxococcales bacterium]MCB9520178.1 MMPL family transporter [Myxococcales bacterium]MCB9531200.1 MMPL family transporter [Myxococcales bacterium]
MTEVGGRSVRRAAWLAGASMVALACFVALRFSATADIVAFMPDGDDRQVAALARLVADSELGRSMVLMVGAPDTDQAVAAARAIETRLIQDPRSRDAFAALDGEPPPDIDRALWELYHDRRLAFVARTPDEAAARATSEALAEAANRLKRELANPMSTLIARVAPSDPLLTMPDLYDELHSSLGGGVSLRDGRFVTEDGHALLFAATRAPAFDATAQRPLLDAIADAFAAENAEAGGTLTLDTSGVNRFAAVTASAVEGDVKRVGVVSSVALLALLFALFRSPRVVVVSALPVVGGVVAGAAATLAAYGRIHGVTLAFGASLIGVAIDYVVHLLCHHAIAPAQSGPRATLDRIWPGLATGAVTTLVGFVALAGSSFRGLQEVALFAVVGISAALGYTRWLLPALLPQVLPASRLRAALARVLAVALSKLRAQRGIAVALLLASLALGTFGLSRAEWGAGLADLGDLDPDLLAEDDRVRSRVARFEQSRFVFAEGATVDEALEANDRVADALRAAVADGELAAFRSAATFVPSPARQRAVAEAFTSAPNLRDRWSTAFVEAGFRPEAFGQFTQALAAPVAPLTWEDVMESPLASMARTFRADDDGRVYFVTFLLDVSDADALAARIADVPGATWVDQPAAMARAGAAVRARTFELFVAGLVAVLLTLVARYRSPRRVAAAFLPAVLGALAAVGALAVAGLAVDLIALTALLMVVSMGVDYGVFLADSDADPDDEIATLVGVFVACGSTVLGFGLLAMSAFPMLRTIGVTAAAGVVACLLVAPASLILLGNAREGEHR